jgi:hypothetical protein
MMNNTPVEAFAPYAERCSYVLLMTTTPGQSGGTFNKEGVLYLPTQRLEIGGNGDMNGASHYFMSIAKEYELRGSGHLHIKDHDGSSPLPNITPDLPDLEAQAARLVE